MTVNNPYQRKILIKESLKSSETEDVKLSKEQEMAVKCWLTEFEGLRNEILNYQRMQNNLIWTNIFIVGTIMGIYFSFMDNKENVILLLIPIISSLLGICWIAHGWRISQIGHYIKSNIAPSLQSLCNDKKILGWEEYVREGIESSFWNYVCDLFLLRVPRATGGGLLFAVFSVMGIVITFKYKDVFYIRCFGVILTLWFMITGYKLVNYWIKDNK